jgi:predicted Zn-dependent protease with MMP-like domain
MSGDAVDRTVDEVLQTVPQWVKDALRDVAVLVDDEDPDEPDLYGAYEDFPPRVVVYRRPLVEDFPDPAELREQVRVTLLHEIGHHFGMDEDRLDDLGYA